MKSRWNEHNNTPYFYCDYSHMHFASLQEEIRAVENALAGEPHNSVRVLVDTQGTRITLQTYSLLKDTCEKMAPGMRKIAVLGASGARQILLEALCQTVGFFARPFESRADAARWLTEEDDQPASPGIQPS